MKVKIKKHINNLKNKKGEVSLTFVISMLFIFMIIMFFVDIFRMTYVYMDAASIAKEVTEIVSIQGGLADTPPESYPDKANYVKRSEVYNHVFDSMAGKKIDKGDLIIDYKKKDGTTGSYKLGSSPVNLEIDYGAGIEVKLRYQFDFVSLPDAWESSSTVYEVKRKAKSQFKHRTEQGWVEDNAENN